MLRLLILRREGGNNCVFSAISHLARNWVYLLHDIQAYYTNINIRLL